MILYLMIYTNDFATYDLAYDFYYFTPYALAYDFAL